MDYKKAKNRIDGLSRFGSVLGLDNIYELLKRLDNPQDKLKIIHVAGTNGKGSTIAYLSSILKEAGYKVGKYTSPVVFEYLEKYQINDENISESVFVALVAKTMVAVEAMVADGNGQPTIFEVETAMAYLYFQESGCDMAIIETGMGGDMDATNVCNKVLASIITSVSLDHTGFLGDTLEEIASHKAGIIKAGCPVVLYGQSDEVTSVIRQYAKKLNAPLVIVKTDIANTVPVTYETATGVIYENIEPSLKGVHQIKNVCTALEAIEQIRKQGFDIDKDTVYKGIKATVWHGRFEQICNNPRLIIDGAHNPGAVTELKATLHKDYKNTTFVFIMGVLADKDFSSEIRMMSDWLRYVITVTPDNPRALDASALADTIKGLMAETNTPIAGMTVAVAASIEDAVEKAVKIYDDIEGDKAILAFGSLSYLGTLKRYVEQRFSV